MSQHGDDKPVDYDSLPASSAGGDKPVDASTQKSIEGRPTHPDAAPASATNGDYRTPAFYTNLTRWHPGIGFFQFLSDCTFSPDMLPHERFNSCIERHPHIYKTCLIIDIAIIITVVLGLATAAGFIGYKTIS